MTENLPLLKMKSGFTLKTRGIDGYKQTNIGRSRKQEETDIMEHAIRMKDDQLQRIFVDCLISIHNIKSTKRRENKWQNTRSDLLI